eukprot:1140664-Pyramimonas_sp.AAC.1
MAANVLHDEAARLAAEIDAMATFPSQVSQVPSPARAGVPAGGGGGVKRPSEHGHGGREPNDFEI